MYFFTVARRETWLAEEVRGCFELFPVSRLLRWPHLNFADEGLRRLRHEHRDN